MSHTTQGTLLLSKLGIAFDLHPYEYDPEAPRIGLHAAESLGIDPSQTFKTLMAEVDGRPVCVVIPSDAEASMKKLAATFGGKAAAMMKVPDAERLTGYKVGGIGPFGQKRQVPTAFDETIELYDHIYINAGQRGLLLSIAPADAARAAEMIVADLTA
jgi:Cys-tRNA(Pro)/Cys-tRNA(Cys) deacylase